MTVVLITGASSGIGEAIAREYVKQGAKVALLARRAEKLKTLCDGFGDCAIALAGDVTKDGDIEGAVAATIAKFGRIDVVVANAGGGVVKPFKEMDIHEFRGQIELNVFGVLRTAYATLPALEASKGSLVIVSSVMAYLAMPAASAYSVSKTAARSLAESLRVDLAPSGVNVTHVAPGFINTELRRVNAVGDKDPNGQDPVPVWMQMPAPTAARKIIRATRWRQRELVLTGHGKIGVFFAMHFAGLTAFVMKLMAKATLKNVPRKNSVDAKAA